MLGPTKICGCLEFKEGLSNHGDSASFSITNRTGQRSLRGNKDVEGMGRMEPKAVIVSNTDGSGGGLPEGNISSALREVSLESLKPHRNDGSTSVCSGNVS
jgi:hypothetical protein